jgi:Zn-dependent protease with chaperone function
MQIKELKLEKEIEVFIYNGQGLINAFAIKFLSKKYVILMSNLVDLMLKREAFSELGIIIGHELGHHALLHTSVMRNLFLLPSKVIPFLNLAYLRGCEFSADRIGFELTKNSKTAIRGLLSITLGSEALADKMDIKEFIKQENDVPSFFGFLSNIFSTHPRMTKRVEELIPFLDSIPEPIVKSKQPIFYDESKYMPKT